MTAPPPPPLGLYLHIPFCRRKCPYCDFYSLTDGGRRGAFLEALHRELALGAAPRRPADTVYFGGGTPSLCTAAEIGALVDAARRHFALDAGAEVTLEANPGTVSPRSLAALRRAGVNRLNLGVQSFDDRALALLGRIHSAGQAREAVAAARAAGFDNLGLDLIYGLPGQTEAAWRRDLEAALALRPEHLSCYMLTYAPGTALARARDAGRVRPLPEGRVAALFLLTAELLAAAGFEHYEIANFARHEGRDLRSRHNRKYWDRSPYLGFGPAAHSCDGGRRFWNAADLDGYLRALAGGGPPPGGAERLDPGRRITEAVMLGLRRATGIDLDAFAAEFGASFEETFAAPLARLLPEGVAVMAEGRFRLTRRGMLLADAVALRLIEGI